MRITAKHILGQLLIILCISVLCACRIRKEEGPVLPPVTSPLSRNYIGFGVITESFTHITADPAEGSPSIGYLRRGSLVKIVRRQTIKNNSGFVSWVLIDDSHPGWLKEEVMDIYDMESQARTASEAMLK
ncbi:MAG: hypothetical protein LBI12_00280 [Treponema sp.]|jgi:hypothetical protein|nr:hypothetical protein [Treponema sp.]